MERRGWILVVGAVTLIGAGVYVWWTDASHGPSGGGTPVVGGEGDGSGAGGGPGEGASPEELGGTSRRRRAFADGGVPHVGPRTEYGSPTDPTENGVRPSRGIPRQDENAHQTTGWRLGQARRRIAILEDRERLYQGAVDRFVAEGNEETAARQRVVLERVQNRLVEFREEEQQLAREAEADGTLGDVDTGYEEGESAPIEPIQGGTTTIR